MTTVVALGGGPPVAQMRDGGTGGLRDSAGRLPFLSRCGVVGGVEKSGWIKHKDGIEESVDEMTIDDGRRDKNRGGERV